MKYYLIENAPVDCKPILCCFKGQFGWVFFVANAFGKHTWAHGYAKPTHWTHIIEPTEEKDSID